MRKDDLFLQSTDIFDAAYLREVTSNDPELMYSLVLLFVEETTQRLAQLKQALQQKNTANALREAHTLKGCCSQLGEGSLHQAAIRLENAVRLQHPPDIDRCVDAFEHEFRRLSLLLPSSSTLPTC
ncbi:Hpt domain-containing protein [Myxococcota bacterium]|nr:Hpt domain-containing protein [Myxococcota bacterium]